MITALKAAIVLQSKLMENKLRLANINKTSLFAGIVFYVLLVGEIRLPFTKKLSKHDVLR